VKFLVQSSDGQIKAGPYDSLDDASEFARRIGGYVETVEDDAPKLIAVDEVPTNVFVFDRNESPLRVAIRTLTARENLERYGCVCGASTAHVYGPNGVAVPGCPLSEATR
jgi:hypothetical protein